MGVQSDKYMVAGFDLADVRNRNEMRVAEAMRAMLEEYGNPELEIEVLQDAYAYALNQLPARYTQKGTIVLGDPVRPQEIRLVVEKAILRVISNPKKR
jgi:vacuolar-type H+-ATPase subunit F/Vma7